MRLVADHPSLGVRDAVRAAAAMHAGIRSIISGNRGLDDVAGLRRIDSIVKTRV